MSKSQHTTDLHDNLCLIKMDWAKAICQRILPKGYWGPGKSAAKEDKHLFLTFDDGPHPDTTPLLLDLFDEENIRVTFFVMGSRTQKHPELLAEIVRRGHTVGNHTLSHRFLPLLSTRQIEKEIGDTSDHIKQVTGQEPILFRPPFGLLDHRGAAISRERKMQTVYWHAVSEDWLGIGDRRVINRTMNRVTHGSLIVLHEGRRIAKQTLTATREIIKLSKAGGYSFEAIPLS